MAVEEGIDNETRPEGIGLQLHSIPRITPRNN